VLAHIIFVTEHGVRSFTEIAGFTAVGRDVATPGEVSKNGQVFDTFNLQFTYRTKGIVALLFKLEALGSDLVDCDDEQGPCTLQFEGPVQFGEISAHGSGGD
jgi:hypothetical protein